MALENFYISAFGDNGICNYTLYYLETDTSRRKMVGL